MSGGFLVVMDRSGRDVKRYPLEAGMATLGSDHSCDIRILQPQVEPHHATVAVHSAHSVVRSVGRGPTLVNGRAVSVAALRHGDVIALGDRALRWEYAHPHHRRHAQHARAASPVGRVPWRGGSRRSGGAGGGGGGSGARRVASVGGAPSARDPELELALEMKHRASMPGSTGGKQVAVVQPQRRDTNEQTDKNVRASPLVGNRRAKNELNSLTTSESESDKSRKSAGPPTSRPTGPLASRPTAGPLPQNTTQATLWIESRKTSPRRKQATPQLASQAKRSLPAKKSTPLRLTVLKKAQSARKVVKIEAPLKIDHTKQAAIMLMTGHTPKSKLSISPQNKRSPSFVVKKASPVRKTPRSRGRQSARRSQETNIRVTPSRGSTFAQNSSNRRSSKRNSGNQSVIILEVTDTTQNSVTRKSNVSARPKQNSLRSPSFPSPKKSAMKDLSKKNKRKTESIKFDLSNLDNYQDTTDASTMTNVAQETENSESEEDLTLHYSDSSNQSPSPRKSINSRSSNLSEQIKKSRTPSTSKSSLPSKTSRTFKLDSPRARQSIRRSGSSQKNAQTSQLSDYSKINLSENTTVASGFRTRTLSPRNNLESYSVVDLVSLESNNSKSIYNSVTSIDTTDFGTPTDILTRKTRSTINPSLLGSSTPYVERARATRSVSSSIIQKNNSRSSISTRRSKSLTTPENKHISVNSTRLSRASRSRSRINDSDLLLLDDTEVEDSSPKTSKRSRTTKSVLNDTSTNMTTISPDNQGSSTPENRHSPVEIGTPVLSIQSLLESSLSSETSQNAARRGRRSAFAKRKTIGVLSEPKRRQDNKAKSLGASARKTLRLRLSGDSRASSEKTDESAPQPDNEEIVTPKSAVKLTPEPVKNKHSTAKKPLSKRSLIDNLNHSDHVKQLFNSPVKRKLSQSMTEFCRKQLFDDDDEVSQVSRPTRNTVALTGRTPTNSILDQTEAITPDRFVSPIGTPDSSPNLSGIKRLFKKNTPENDLRDVRGVRGLLRTPNPRTSTKNDLTNVDAVKNLFARSPRNRLSDVRVKEVFVASPNNDLRRVGGVKSLFQKPPKNDLSDFRGVRKMFQRKSPENDLRNVSGVKRTLRNSPKNDLRDVRGVRRTFKPQRRSKDYHDVSGVEELFNESNQSVNKSETLFDTLVGKPTIKSVYSKTFSAKSAQKPKNRKGKSLHSSIDVITNNVEEWLENELQRRLQNKSNMTKQLKMLATDTVRGGEPILESRTRNSSIAKKSASEIYSAHKLPIKKRSLVEVSLKKNPVNLPIKKRVVVHSTPVKGRANMIMNASELGRVSPITAVDNTRESEQNTANTRSTQLITEDNVPPKLIKARTPRKQQTPKKIDIAKPSPQKSPEKETLPTRSTRNRKNMDTTHTKKRLSSIIITKKPPVMSPKAEPKPASKAKKPPATSPKKTTRATRTTLKAVAPVESLNATRASRNKRAVTMETPKRTRTRADKQTVVITKPSPTLKPQPKEATAKSQTVRGKPKTNSTETAVVANKPPMVSLKITRKTQVNTSPKQTKTTSKRTKLQEPEVCRPAQARRKRATVDTEQTAEPKRVRRGPNAVEASVQKLTKTRGKKNVNATESSAKDTQLKTRKKVEMETKVQSEPTSRRRGIQSNVEEKPQPRGKRAAAKSAEIESKTRGKKVEVATTVVPELAKRSRRTKPEEPAVPETKGRKRKAAAIEEGPAKVAKAEPKRGKKVDSPKIATKAVSKHKKTETGNEVPAKRSMRGKQNKLEETKPLRKDTKPVKGKETVENKESVPAPSARGKRKANVDPSPAKVAAKRVTTKASPLPSPPRGTRSRSTRGKNISEAAAQPTGRSRRR